VDIQSSLLSHLHQLYYNLGCVLHQQGKLADAAKSYYQAITIPSSDHLPLAFSLNDPVPSTVSYSDELKSHIIKVLNNLGCLLLQQENWQEAIQIYQQAIELQPEEASLYNNLGRALFQDDPIQAIQAYRQATELQPDLVVAHHNLGLLLQHQGQHQAALAAFSQALQLAPDQAKIHNDCAFSRLVLGQFDAMIVHMRSAILPEAELIQAYCQTVAQHSETDQLTLAKHFCGKFLNALLNSFNATVAEADHFIILHYLMQTYYHWANTLTTYGGTEQYQRAETFYQRALQIEPYHPALLVGLIDNLIQQQRWNAAVTLCHTAIAFSAASSSELSIAEESQYPSSYSSSNSSGNRLTHLLDGTFTWQFYWQLGYALEQQQQFQAAIHAYQTALELQNQPNVPSPVAAYVPSSLTAFPAPSSASIQQFYPTTLTWVGSHPTPQPIYQSLPQASLSEHFEHSTPAALPSCDGDCPLEAKLAPGETPCAGINCNACLKTIHERFSPIGLGEQLYDCTGAPEPARLDPVSLFVVTIPQGQAWNVPQQNDWMVCNATAILTPDRILLADLSRSYPGNLPDCENSSPKFHRIFTQTNLPALETVDGRVVALSSLSGNTYFHWMVDLLPRIELLRRSGLDFDQVDRFLINGGNAAFQQATLRHLGIPVEKLLSSDHHPYIQADHLIVPSFTSPFGWIEPWATAFLRQTFLPLANCVEPTATFPDPTTPLPEFIYISRAGAKHRQVLNEPALLDRLQACGFTSIQLETLSFEEQVTLFAHAKVIVAPHGSGLTNILFCRPGTTVIELMSPHYIRSYYWVISRQLQLQHYYLVGESVDAPFIRDLMYQNPLLEDIWIDLNIFDSMLARLDLNPPPT
jgi:capsular polysaccharide biosynthesis protein/tetratricopeptide (TPR) repeat protein